MYKAIHKQTQVLQKYAQQLIEEKSVPQEWYDVSKKIDDQINKSYSYFIYSFGFNNITYTNEID